MGVPQSIQQGVQRTPRKTSNIPAITVTRVYPMYPRRVFVQWILRNAVKTSTYKFNVYRSGSAEGSWEHLGVDIPEFYYVDEAFPAPEDREEPGLYSLTRVIYYKITAEAVAGGIIYEVIKKLEPWLDRRRAGIHRKLVRDAFLALKKVEGTEVAILKRLRWGEPCTCRTSTGQTTRAHCPECYGTSFKGGYWNPVYSYGKLGAAPVSVQTAIQGKVERLQTNIIIPNVPQVEKEDIIAFIRSDRRFTVLEVNPTQIHNVDVHQELIASELARSSAEYNLPIDPWHEPCWWVV